MTNLTRYSYPTTPRNDRFFGPNLFSDFDRLFEVAAKRAAAPRAYDLYEDDRNYFAQVELPGVKKEAVALELDGDVLTVTVTRPDVEDGAEAPKWTQSVHVPEEIAADQVSAKLEDGILTVTLPKVETPKPVQISIS